MSTIYPATPFIGSDERANLLGQIPLVVWMTGLSGSGKTTLALMLEKELLERGFKCIHLDGDQIRQGLNRDLGFTEMDRRENIRRTAELCKLLVDSGYIVITSLISPYRSDRNSVKELVNESRFLEVYVNTPLSVCEERDTKGLYKKARAGELPDFTGISAPYEAPEKPDLELDTAILPRNEALKLLLECVIRRCQITK